MWNAVLEHHGLKVKYPGEKADGQRERLRSHLEALLPGPAQPPHTKKRPLNISALMPADTGSTSICPSGAQMDNA